MTAPKTIAAGGLLSLTEVGKLLEAHRSTVWLWVQRGMLKAAAHGHFHGVHPKDLKVFLQAYKPTNGLVASELDAQIVKLKTAKKPARKKKNSQSAKKRAKRKGAR